MFLEDALDLERAIRALSPEARVERRRAMNAKRYRKYQRSEKGRARQRRYDASPKGQARHLLYEKTIRAAMRAPRPTMDDLPVGPNPFGNACGSEDGRVRTSVTMAGAAPAEYSWLTGRKVPRRFPPDPFDIRRAYAEQIRAERRAGILTPMTFAQLLASRGEE